MGAKFFIVLGIAAVFVTGVSRIAAMADDATTQPSTQTTGDDEMIGGSGPALSDPVGRQGGGVRSTHAPSDPAFWISVLAPVKVGQTAKASPALVFYLSKPTEDRVIVTVTELRNTQAPAVLSWSSDAPVAAGLHEIDLAKLGGTLKPNVIYRWTAAVRLEEENPATQIFDAGLIRYVPGPETSGKNFYDAVAAGFDAIRAANADTPAAVAQLKEILNESQISDVKVDVANPPEKKSADSTDGK